MKKNHRNLLFLLLFVFLPYLLGMSALGGVSNPEKIPIPEKKFTATFIDQYDVVTECHDVSFQGSTFIEGKRGLGTFTISFAEVHSVVFLQSGAVLKAIIKMKNGGNVELALNKEQHAYGLTSVGTYQIKLSDLKMMTDINPK